MAYSTHSLIDYLAARKKEAGDAARYAHELKEAYVRTIGETVQAYETAIPAVAERLIAAPEAGGADLHAAIEARREEERRIIAERRRALREQIIPESHARADALVKESQDFKASHHENNLKKHGEQAELDAQRVQLEAQLEQLNAEIAAHAGCLNVVRHFFKLWKLTRQRKKVYDALQTAIKKLGWLRSDWEKEHQDLERILAELESRWNETVRQRTQDQAELEALDDPQHSESLALKRAVRHILDERRAPVTAPDAALQEQINALVDLHHRRENFEAAIARASHLTGVLEGIQKGLDGIAGSVKQLAAQERKYASYLPKLRFTLPTQATAFHDLWSALADKLSGQAAHYTQHPEEFTQMADEVLQAYLTDEKIAQTFTQMGNALQQATARWNK